MNFVHPLRSPRAPAEGSMERSHFVWLFSINRGGPCADFIGYPHRNAAAGQERRGKMHHSLCIW